MNEEERKYLKDKLDILAYDTYASAEIERGVEFILSYIDSLIKIKKIKKN